METKDIIFNLRQFHNLSQDKMAEKLFVTRQAVSRWETGETIPNPETLKIISKEFNISINTLLGSPQKLICQCCGMPLDDNSISRELDGIINEEYCKWCYKDGELVYPSLEALMDFLVPHLASIHKCEKKEMQIMLEKQLPKLNLWKQK